MTTTSEKPAGPDDAPAASVTASASPQQAAKEAVPWSALKEPRPGSSVEELKEAISAQDASYIRALKIAGIYVIGLRLHPKLNRDRICHPGFVETMEILKLEVRDDRVTLLYPPSSTADIASADELGIILRDRKRHYETHFAEIRDLARRRRYDGFFSENEIKEVLTDMGLEPHKINMIATLRMTRRWRVPDEAVRSAYGDSVRRQIDRMLNDILPPHNGISINVSFSEESEG